MRNIYLIIFAIALIGLGGFFWLSNGNAVMSNLLKPATAVTSTSQNDMTGTDQDFSADITEMTLGNADAPITVIEYASYTCPHCQSFHEGNFKKLKTDYIDTGKVYFIYREVYFDLPGLWASIIARCDGPDKFFAISDLIYKHQRDWTSGGNPTEIADKLRRIGLSAGLSAEQLQACLTDEDKAKALTNWYDVNSKRDDINSTPSFVIDGVKYSNMEYAKFRDILESKL